MLNKDADTEVYRSIEDKINLHNATALYQLSQVFKFSKLRKSTILFIERCFPIISESRNFLHLDYKNVVQIFSSSYLNIDSELEVFNAVVSWLDYNKERKTFAKHLIFKVRLSLLSVPAVRFFFEKTLSFIENPAYIKEIIDKKSKGIHKRNLKTISRFCNQDNFNIIVCGGTENRKAVRGVYSIKANNLKNVTRLPHFENGRRWSKVVCLKGDIFVFGGFSDDFTPIMSIKKYSNDTKTWKVVGCMPDKNFCFCVCSFMGSAYILGGLTQLEVSVASCFKFKAADCSTCEMTDMETARNRSACAVFEGKVVVSGGGSHGRQLLNTVEAYDHVADEWTSMPDMVKERIGHKSVARKNKLYMIGGFTKTSEVYDSICEKFVLLKSPDACFLSHLDFPLSVISICNKLVVFRRNKSFSVIYDVENETWSEEPCEVSRNLSSYSCVKVPQY